LYKEQVNEKKCFVGVPLSISGAGEKCQTMAEAAAAEYSNYHAAIMAIR